MLHRRRIRVPRSSGAPRRAEPLAWALLPRATMQILAALAHSTRPDHARIGRSIPLARPSLSLDVYRAHLARLLGFYEPVEEALASHAWASVGLDFEVRRKLPLLAADLACLGLDEGAIASLPRCAAIPGLPALPEALGCAYVLEGATRGARVLGRLVGASLGVTRSRGCAFLLAYGDEADARWRAFGASLDEGVRDEETAGRVLEAARETFARLQRWLEDGGPRDGGR